MAQYSSISDYARHIYPQIGVLSLDDGRGRRLIARSNFMPGDVIFSEAPVLHTAHPIARNFQPTSELDIPFDWQRLLYLYGYCRSSGVETDRLSLAMHDLSTSAVTSIASRMADPERASEYREWAELWITAIPELSDSVPTVTADEIERLLAILETNSHSRDENDQVDLSDPRLPPPPKIDDEHNSTLIGEEDEEEKDEACGLWLVASMANHSCIPNCVVHIPSTRGLQPSAVPTLLFRCIRPVFAGDELTINYQDDEFALTDDRQAQLSSRGFKCTCPLCTSQIREYMRSATCPSPSCSRGASCPQRISGSVQWSCDACGTRLTPSQVSVVEKLQEDWMSLWPSILETLESSAERPAALPFNLLQSLTSLAERRQDPHTFILGLDLQQHGFGGNVNLHISHGYVYAFLKFILFEQSVWLRQRYGDDGVTGTLLAAAAIVERAYQALPELKVASEERRALGYWLVREARTRWGDVHGRESFWDEVESIGWARWTEGMKILYGREDEDMG